MKPIYKPANTVIREKQVGLVEVIEDGEYGAGTDREGMPYSRIVATFESVALARRSFPHAHIDMAMSDAMASYQSAIVDRIYSHIGPSSMDTEVEPDPTFDAAADIRYDDQGVPY